MSNLKLKVGDRVLGIKGSVNKFGAELFPDYQGEIFEIIAVGNYTGGINCPWPRDYGAKKLSDGLEYGMSGSDEFYKVVL